MSAVTMLATPPCLFDREKPPLFAAGRHDDGPTLEDLVRGVWEDLSSQRSLAACPVCRGDMVARYGAGPAAVGGRCLDCGSELA